MKTTHVFTLYKNTYKADDSCLHVYVDGSRIIDRIKAPVDTDGGVWQWAWDNLNEEQIDGIMGKELVSDAEQDLKWKRWVIWKDKKMQYHLAPIPNAIHKDDFNEQITPLLKKPIKKFSTICKMFML